jgi:ergothioneine biosynthesis protein EgtB
MASGSGIDTGTPPAGVRVTAELDRVAVLDWYRRNRARSARLFEMLAERCYVTRPIALRNPIVFYEGHLPGFSVNILIKKGLGRTGVDARLEEIFARGIDPEDEALASPRGGVSAWPARDEVRRFADACDRLLEHALLHDEVDRPGVPVLERAEGVFTLLEHEAMHQETLLYMWHQVPHGDKKRPSGYTPDAAGEPPVQSSVTVPAGIATLGADRHAARFGWDNEFDAHEVVVPAFEIDAHDVTNAAFLEFVQAGGYDNSQWWSDEDFGWVQRAGIRHPMFWEQHGHQWFWRGQFDRLPLPPAWPVYVSHAEASAFARWRGKRLPTEAEFHRAAYGTPGGLERSYPWGEDPPDATRGHFGLAGWDPVPAGSRPAGASAWGVHDLVGNGWEWTSTVFAPFEGFRPMPSYPEYSAEFFDGQHYVLKGASPATAHELLRRSFRNWFRPHYPYVYAAFRCARSLP